MKIIEKIKYLISKISRKKGIFYINGPNTLPTPLTREEENELVKLLPDDQSAKQTLIERNLRLVVYIAKRFENTGIGLEDLISI